MMKFRIKKVRDGNGSVCFTPQVKGWFFWHSIRQWERGTFWVIQEETEERALNWCKQFVKSERRLKGKGQKTIEYIPVDSADISQS
jgi:hypothetical protein